MQSKFKRAQVEPSDPILEFGRTAPVMQPLGLPAKVFLWSVAVFLVLGAFNVLFGGIQGGSYAFHRVQDTLLSLVAWKVEVFWWLGAIMLLVLAFVARYSLPTILVPVMGAGEKEARTITVWYRPGSFRVESDMAYWKEGSKEARINKTFVSRLHGMGFMLTTPVLRRVDEARGVIYYETVGLEASRLEAQGERERILARQVLILRSLLEQGDGL